MKTPKTNRADDLFWISGVASIATSGYAIGTMNPEAFYAAAVLMCVSMAAFMWGANDE